MAKGGSRGRGVRAPVTRIKSPTGSRISGNKSVKGGTRAATQKAARPTAKSVRGLARKGISAPASSVGGAAGRPVATQRPGGGGNSGTRGGSSQSAREYGITPIKSQGRSTSRATKPAATGNFAPKGKPSVGSGLGKR